MGAVREEQARRLGQAAQTRFQVQLQLTALQALITGLKQQVTNAQQALASSKAGIDAQLSQAGFSRQSLPRDPAALPK